MKKIGFATIGTNFIVDWFLAAAELCGEFELRAVYSRTLEKGRGFAGSREGVKVYDSLEALAADPDIDAVYIASPTSCHAGQAVMMLEAGKHVLCEKPAASNRKEWGQMLDAADKAGKVVLEAMRPLFSPGFLAIRDSLTELGTIRMASFSYCQYSSRYDKFKQGIIENAFRPEFSNGALMDIGIYCTASMVGLFGRPARVYGFSYGLEGSIDGMGTICAVYEEMLGTASYSKISDAESDGVIQGEKGTLTYDCVGSPANVRIKYRSGAETVIFQQPDDHDMMYEIRAFIRMIQGKEDPDEFHRTTGLTLELTDTVRAQNGIIFPADR